MRRRPPRSTRTDTLFPYTTLVRSDRLTLQPDWLANISTDYRIEMGGDDEVVLSAGLFGKGKRLAATLNETTPTFLDSYWLTNASIAYRTGPVEVALFANKDRKSTRLNSSH